jgi:hypothetical protein
MACHLWRTIYELFLDAQEVFEFDDKQVFQISHVHLGILPAK